MQSRSVGNDFATAFCHFCQHSLLSGLGESVHSSAKPLHHFLGQLSQSSIVCTQSRSLVVADTGATDHMTPDKSVFISYKAVSNLQVRMGNNSFIPVLGRGTAIFSLNGQCVLVRNVLHVPGLAVPLYSLRAHLNQPGSGFFGTFEAGMLVYFPTFVLSVDTSTNCHLSYEPLSCSAPLSTLHYVQPRCAPTLYPSEVSPSTCNATPVPAPFLVADTDSSFVDAQPPPLYDNTTSILSTAPSIVSPPGGSSLDISLLATQLRALADSVHSMTSPPLVSSILPSTPLAPSQPVPTASSPPLSSPDDAILRVTLLSTMPHDSIVKLIHHADSPLPSIRPCDTTNNSDTKMHWTAEELHRIMGCQKFCNYKHILQVSRDGEWVGGGEFPPSLRSFATIPKANHGGPLDCTKHKFLDAVHMDIMFGDCLSIGSFRYALILVDSATCYNWTFGLKMLTSASILSALCLFRAFAGSLARCFYSDCDVKLFGTAISEYLIDSNSKVVAAPAKRQSSNGLVKSHWKTMVCMGRAYLTEKQMPCTYWFYAITHAARMMNAIPGKHLGYLATPFLLVHGIGHDEHTWIPLFSLCYFHHVRNGNQKRSKHQAHTMDGIVIGRSPTLNALLVYSIILGTSNSTSRTVTPLTHTAFQPRSTLVFDMTVTSSVPWSATTIPSWKRSTRLVLELNVWILLPICLSPERLWTFPSRQPTPILMALITMGHIQYYLIMGLLHRFHSLRWQASSCRLWLFLLIILLPHLWIHFCLLFYVFTPASCTNTTVNITRVSLDNRMVSTALSSNLTSISAKKIGGSTSPISPITGSTFVSRVFLFLATSLTPSCILPVLLPLAPMIQLHLLSVR